jgi:hypothetical protein
VQAAGHLFINPGLCQAIGGLIKVPVESCPNGFDPDEAPCDRRTSLCSTISGVPDSSNHRLQRVLDQLRLYEHPLLDFDARAKGEGVEVIIQFKNPSLPVHTYYFELHPRDLDHAQFEWTFQRQLYDCLHDYLIEMFTRTPQNRAERQREGL